MQSQFRDKLKGTPPKRAPRVCQRESHLSLALVQGTEWVVVYGTANSGSCPRCCKFMYCYCSSRDVVARCVASMESRFERASKTLTARSTALYIPTIHLCSLFWWGVVPTGCACSSAAKWRRNGGKLPSHVKRGSRETQAHTPQTQILANNVRMKHSCPNHMSYTNHSLLLLLLLRKTLRVQRTWRRFIKRLQIGERAALCERTCSYIQYMCHQYYQITMILLRA